MNRSFHAAVAVAATALLIFPGGCGRSPGGGVAVYVSGDTAGWITPCGCAANQSGGLARRGTLIGSGSGPQSTLVLDAGGSASGTSEYHQVKLRSLLRGMTAMGLAAHNVGAPEARLEPETLREMSDTGVSWLSANLAAADGSWQPDKLLVFDRGGMTIAVTGVVDPATIEDPGWHASDPLQAVLNAMRDVTADVRIVLAYMKEPDLKRLAAALPEVDFVIGGPTGQSVSPVDVGPATVLSVTNKGKFLARLDLKKTAPGDISRSTELLEVSASLDEDAAQLRNLSEYYAELARRDFTADSAGLVSSLVSNRDDYSIAGSQSCTACHARDDAVWHASRHSHAWDVLVPKGAHFDPFCQQCHTTGYGLDGGFVNVASSAARVHVGCENCHGPSQAHAANPRIKTPLNAMEQCIVCHDHENSPEFVQPAYWAKIAHGRASETASE